MALGTSFWATDWADIRVLADFASMSASSTSLGASWYEEVLSQLYGIRQLEAAGDNSLNSKNSGRFYMVNAAEDDYRDINYIHMSGRMVSDPNTYLGIEPSPSGEGAAYPHPPCADPTLSGTCTVTLYYKRPSTGGEWYDLMHFQPYTYYGNPAEVIAAMLVHLGATDKEIDEDSFSAAHTGQAAMTTEPLVLVTREVGETVAQTIKRVAQHSNDILYVGMNGKIGMASRTSPPAGPDGLTVADTIGPVSWAYQDKYIVNKAVVSFGEWSMYWGSRTNYPTGSGWTFAAKFDREANWDTAGLLTADFEDATSAALYGSIVLSNAKKDMNAINADTGRVVDGEFIKRPAYHFHYFFDEDMRDVIMARMTAVESQMRREVEIVEDLRGVDYDIGYELTDVQVTGDGATIAAMTCIEKEIDFAKLTVRSVLLEEPS